MDRLILNASLPRRPSFGSSHHLPTPGTSAKTKGTFLSLCLRASRSWQRTLDAAKFCKRLLSVHKSTNSDGITKVLLLA